LDVGKVEAGGEQVHDVGALGGPSVIILPDVRGLYRFYVALAERCATTGYHALAIDYFGRTAGIEDRDDEFDFMSHTMQTTSAKVQADITAARDTLADRTGATSFVTIGFCFGGADELIPPDDIQAFDDMLTRNGVPHEIHSYPGAPAASSDLVSRRLQPARSGGACPLGEASVHHCRPRAAMRS
jgi:dienelactone hydrolase